MGLADKFEEIYSQRNKPSDYCAYQAMHDSLSPDNQKALDDAWKKGYSVNVVITALRAEGIKTSADSVRAHKNGICKCPKK
jgi:hypothetical protein